MMPAAFDSKDSLAQLRKRIEELEAELAELKGKPPTPTTSDAEERLRLAAEASGMAIWDLDVEGGLMRWSKDPTLQVSSPPKRTLRDAFATIHPDDQQEVMAALERSIRTREPLVIEYRSVRKDGSIAWIAARGRMIDGDGTPSNRLIGVAFDVTQRHLHEAETHEREARLHALYQHAPVGLLERSPEGRLLSANPMFCSLVGFPAEQISELHIQQIVLPEDLEAEAKAIKSLLDGRARNYRLSQRMVRKDGRLVWVDVEGALLQTGKHPVLLNIVQDMTVVRLTEFALRESEERQKLAIEIAGIGTYDLNMTTGELRWSEQLRRIYGLAPFTPITMDMFLSMVHPEDRTRVESVGWESRASEDGVYRDQFRIVRPDGSVRWVVARGQNLFDTATEERSLVRMIGAVMDITDLRRQEEALQAANEELVRANADLNQFAYAAAHDLQEPLRNVALSVQLLQRKYKDQLDEGAQNFIALASEGAIRMQALVEDLLGYTQAINAQELPQGSVDSEAVLQAVLKDLASLIDSSGARIEVQKLPGVRVLELHLTQILQNLISNAIKYRRPEVMPEISIRADLDGEFYRFCVADNGLGIKPEYHERIFGVFKRLHGREIPGTGIGLAICRRIVEHYQGRIWIESEPDAGSMFFFTLPA
jgi:PAS domain S-box-containing protein